MKLKARKIRVWCHETPVQVKGCPNDWAMGERIRNKVTNSYGRVKRLPIRVTCPDCKKRFRPRIRECHDPNCWHVYIPAHKKEVKVKRK